MSQIGSTAAVWISASWAMSVSKAPRGLGLTHVPVKLRRSEDKPVHCGPPQHSAALAPPREVPSNRSITRLCRLCFAILHCRISTPTGGFILMAQNLRIVSSMCPLPVVWHGLAAADQVHLLGCDALLLLRRC